MNWLPKRIPRHGTNLLVTLCVMLGIVPCVLHTVADVLLNSLMHCPTTVSTVSPSFCNDTEGQYCSGPLKGGSADAKLAFILHIVV
jgi:hypothetical protein